MTIVLQNKQMMMIHDRGDMAAGIWKSSPYPLSLCPSVGEVCWELRHIDVGVRDVNELRDDWKRAIAPPGQEGWPRH
jgi:hypothetical protein